jgi:hypothetical protein
MSAPRLIKGIELKNNKLCRIMSDDMKHFNYQYHEGENIDTSPFYPNGFCDKGGLYFTNEEIIFKYLGHGSKIADIHVDDDEDVYLEYDIIDGVNVEYSYKAHKVYVTNIRTLNEYFDTLSCDKYIYAIKLNPDSIKYIRNQTDELCKLALNKDGTTIRHIRDKRYEYLLLAVSKASNALEYIEEQTDEICWIAIMQDTYALQYVKKQTIDICKYAVNKNPSVEMFVKIPFSEI